MGMYNYSFVGIGVSEDLITERAKMSKENFFDYCERNLRWFNKGDIGEFVLVRGENAKKSYVAIIINNDTSDEALEGMDPQEDHYLTIIDWKNELLKKVLSHFKINIRPEEIYLVSGSFTN